MEEVVRGADVRVLRARAMELLGTLGIMGRIAFRIAPRGLYATWASFQLSDVVVRSLYPYLDPLVFHAVLVLSKYELRRSMCEQFQSKNESDNLIIQRGTHDNRHTVQSR